MLRLFCLIRCSEVEGFNDGGSRATAIQGDFSQ
jgi:hypothetical protein